jgi:hypothetical protein
MTFHDLGALGTADVMKKYLAIQVKMPWETFSLRFTAELADISAGTIMILQEAFIRKKEIKIKKEADELDRFFHKIESAVKKPLAISPSLQRIPATPVRRKFRKGKEIRTLTGEGNYVIALFVENAGDFNLEQITIIDKVLDAFQYTDFDPVEPELDNKEQGQMLRWRIQILEPNYGYCVTYKINRVLGSNVKFTNFRYCINFAEQEEQPGTYDCLLEFKNEFSGSIKLLKANVYAPDDVNNFFVEIDPADSKIISSGAKWVSNGWEYTTPEPHTEPQFLVDIDVLALDTVQTQT